ncbi:MAG: Sec-independent protein translocase protein TatB [Alphaproteobacteria bacterium]
MFDIAWSELFVIGAVALVAIGPKDLPKTMLMLGKAARQVQDMTHDLRRQWEQLSYEAEVAERQKEEAEKEPQDKKDDASSIS